MQETTITRRFTLERHSTLGQATAATMKAVEAALGGTLEQTVDGGFSGRGRAFPRQQWSGLNQASFFETYYNVNVTGKLKEHGNGEYSVLITLSNDGANTIGRLMAVGNLFNLIGIPALVGPMSFFMFRGSMLAGLIGAGIGFAIAIAILSASGKLPAKALQNGRDAVENKLATIEFSA